MADSARCVQQSLGNSEVTSDDFNVIAEVQPRYAGPSGENSDALAPSTEHVHNLQPGGARTADYENRSICQQHTLLS